MIPNSSHQSFSGERLRARDLPDLSLIETAYRPGLRMPRHSHEPAYLGFLLAGAYSERCGRKDRTCEPSTLLFHPPDEDHAVQFHNVPVRIFRVEVKSPYLARVREHSKVLDSPTEFRGGWTAQLALRLYREFQEMDQFSPLAIEGLMLEILAEASRRQTKSANSQPPRWLTQAKDLLHAQYAEPLTLESIAETVGVHRVYLAREFRRHYHCTIGEYVRWLRIEAACREMMASNRPLAEIAAEAGFYDQSHFSRTFKRLTGLTPAEYRALSRAS